MESFLDAVLQGNIAIFHIALQRTASHTVFIILECFWRFHRIFPHSLIGCFSIEIADAFHIGIGQH